MSKHANLSGLFVGVFSPSAGAELIRWAGGWGCVPVPPDTGEIASKPFPVWSALSGLPPKRGASTPAGARG